MNEQAPAFKPPIVETDAIKEIARGVFVIPDTHRTLMVPNIGVVVGSRAALVIDTGFGPANARAVIDAAKRLAGARPLFLTHTHCHPEHGFGANVAATEATIVYNDAQWRELQEKGTTILRMFRDRMPALAPLLEGVEFVPPHLRYAGSLDLDLGDGLIVELREFGGAHSRGDQGVVIRSSSSVLFTGDLIEEGYFPVLADNESHVGPWIDRLRRFEALTPDIVVPGHGLIAGANIVAAYRFLFEFAKWRVEGLRETGEASEAEILDRVSQELLEAFPNLENPRGARKIAADLAWPSRS